ncbi:hypothetical protein JW911_00690 [Candidatus Peregrinibacteria bacterium]|nr:hypothetical protein [Candidatus Peregrinibacteria bacterium]
MKKTISGLIVISFCFLNFSFQTIYAQVDQSGLELGTLLPQPKQETMLCKDRLDDLDELADPVKEFKESSSQDRNEILACGIQTGRIHFWMVPYYVVYLIQFIIGIAGLIAVLFLVLGGYQYVISGLGQDKEKGKKTITNALIGLVVVLVAWVVVNVVQYVLTV